MRNNIQPPPITPLTDKSASPPWINWFNVVYRFLGLAPSISSGIVAPTTTPNKIGDIFVDTVAKKIYVAAGNTSSADWIIVN